MIIIKRFNGKYCRRQKEKNARQYGTPTSYKSNTDLKSKSTTVQIRKYQTKPRTPTIYITK